jgi:nucleoside-diphosphate-sugar epimerase
VITVIGGSGFIGRHLIAELERRGTRFQAPGREERLEGRALGDLVYCAGVTTEFRTRPLDTVAAHVGDLERILRTAEVESVVYLSTTLFYRGEGVATESDAPRLDPADPDRLYETTKAAGEALVLASGVPALVLRLANVYGVDPGSQNFVPSIVRDAVSSGEVTLRSSLDSIRDYVAVDDVVTALLALLDAGARGIYNVAGPGRVSHREIAEALAELTGCTVHVAPGAPTATAPEIDTAKLRAAIDHRPESLLDALPALVEGYRSALSGVAR